MEMMRPAPVDFEELIAELGVDIHIQIGPYVCASCVGAHIHCRAGSIKTQIVVPLRDCVVREGLGLKAECVFDGVLWKRGSSRVDIRLYMEKACGTVEGDASMVIHRGLVEDLNKLIVRR